ncbi:hypothetical protein [Elizabethkingia bruuniana]|uniref:hypothetical protein n=1 Tax=Elizabethkingia bruuniana TaxID=1756149 RepID=UPI00099AB9FC|nr:hypothetical protein [Elizabethkingia bruuniana]OPC53445.1 hypothetical protein BAY07_15455 [Elizabethkingia bruuniana]
MTLYLCIKDLDTLIIDWNLIRIPQIGEQIYIKDFLSDPDKDKILQDIMTVKYIQWIKLNDIIYPVLFLEYGESNLPEIDMPSIN